MDGTTSETESGKSGNGGKVGSPDKGRKEPGKSVRHELRRVWFVHNITLDGSTLKDYVSLPAPRDGEKIPATVPRCFLVGESLAVRVEWKGPSGQRQVRVVPMANVICFEPVSDATD